MESPLATLLHQIDKYKFYGLANKRFQGNEMKLKFYGLTKAGDEEMRNSSSFQSFSIFSFPLNQYQEDYLVGGQ